MSWYVYLNREQHYLRSYRTHNLWLDYYQKKIRTPRVTSFHLGVFKRLAKTYSGVSNGRAHLSLMIWESLPFWSIEINLI